MLFQKPPNFSNVLGEAQGPPPVYTRVEIRKSIGSPNVSADQIFARHLRGKEPLHLFLDVVSGPNELLHNSTRRLPQRIGGIIDQIGDDKRFSLEIRMVAKVRRDESILIHEITGRTT